VKTRNMLAALRRAHEEADQLYKLAAAKDPMLAMAIAHRLSSSIEGMRLAIQSTLRRSPQRRLSQRTILGRSKTDNLM
jgi:hypothetical protein